MNETILVVDDDPEIVGAIAITLEREGYRILRAYNGMEALDHALDPAVRLILIDVMMPKLDGLSALIRIREKRNLPIIVLSAKSEDTDKILGLSMGADDYITKPYNPQELAARVRSQLRRYTSLGDIHAEGRGRIIVNGRLAYDPDSLELRADGDVVKLTPTETRIVDLLIRNPGRVFPAEEIYRRVWNEEAFSCENTVMVHIRRIREKIELNPKEPDYIKVALLVGVLFVTIEGEGTNMKPVFPPVSQDAADVFRHILQIPLVHQAVDLPGLFVALVGRVRIIHQTDKADAPDREEAVDVPFHQLQLTGEAGLALA